MNNKKVYVFCPAASYTGGPTLAHQLCHCLRSNGIDAVMWYDCNPLKRAFINPIHPRYEHFNNPYVLFPPKDSPDYSIIALESKVSLLRKYKKAHRYIWWMSVDNYFLNMYSTLDLIKTRLFNFTPTIEYRKKYENKKRYSIIADSDITHLVQSEYARLFLISRKINENKIFDLGDYLEEEILKIDSAKYNNRNLKTVLYNPKKGFEFTSKLISIAPELKWTPLENMTKQQVSDKLLSSRLYIDFGNHPGKDRFPREAAICGCCVITGKRGSAANSIDIPIPEDYKFDESTDPHTIINKIREVLNNYELCSKDFDSYRDSIRREKASFERQVVSIFK